MTARSLLRSALSATAVALALLAAPGAPAQRATGQLTADVPFAFQAGQAQVPAGSYTLRTPNDFLLRLQGGASLNDLHTTTYLWEHAPHDADRTKLVFHRYAGHYFLREVHFANSNEFLSLVESPAEKAMRRDFELSRARPDAGTTELAGLSRAH